MITTTHTLSWEFGGWLEGQPAGLAWSVLVAFAVVGVGLFYWSYRKALVELTPKRRVVLGLLRTAVWAGLITILAAPTRIDRNYEQRNQKALAVLVDRSGSMTTADNRQRRRLDDALVRWRAMAPAARATFGGPNVFAFADTLSAVPNTDAPVDVKADQTNFFKSLQQVLADAPTEGWGGIVVLTDGLDTSGEAIDIALDHTARAALACGTPLYFVPGRNRYAGGEFFTLRDFSVPGQVAPRSTFRVEATFDSYQAAPRNLTVNLKVNGVARPAAAMRVEAGRRMAEWSAEVQADAPGVIELELQAGEEIARATVRVALPPTNRILYFQGALDWSYRFLADILKRDMSFELTPVFSFPNPNAPLPAGALARLPATPEELAAFDIVILANVVATQLTPAQQKALENWVRDGGVLLFLAPDDDSTQGFSGSELEKMLPVIFAKPTARDRATEGMLGTLRNLGGRGGGSDPTTLQPFVWEQTPQVREIFEMAAKTGTELPTPIFSDYAHVAGAKPGAMVLARHPVDTVPGGERAILLALQRYGRGRSVVLASDSLWRWKLNQPSGERGTELFWQNLFSWLTRDRQSGLAFDHAPLHAPLGREVALRLVGAGSEKLRVEAVLGGQRLVLPESGSDVAARIFPWRPATAGYWQIIATDASGRQASHWLSVDHATQTGEYSGIPPDEELMRDLANRTGGAVLENAPPAAWQMSRQASDALLGEQKTQLWHQRWVLGVLLGLYGFELLLRRWWKML